MILLALTSDFQFHPSPSFSEPMILLSRVATRYTIRRVVLHDALSAAIEKREDQRNDETSVEGNWRQDGQGVGRLRAGERRELKQEENEDS